MKILSDMITITFNQQLDTTKEGKLLQEQLTFKQVGLVQKVVEQAARNVAQGMATAYLVRAEVDHSDLPGADPIRAVHFDKDRALAQFVGLAKAAAEEDSHWAGRVRLGNIIDSISEDDWTGDHTSIRIGAITVSIEALEVQ